MRKSSATTDFTDDGDILYTEAVSVLYTMEVISGHEDKSFRPDETLSRGGAATIICNLILGPAAARELNVDAAPISELYA